LFAVVGIGLEDAQTFITRTVAVVTI